MLGLFVPNQLLNLLEAVEVLGSHNCVYESTFDQPSY